MSYRMYIDEVGNADLGASMDTNHRYLSLTGVILDMEYVDNTVFPGMERLKRKYFLTHADDPVVFHRKELVNHKNPFEALRDPGVEASFNADLLAFIKNTDFVAVTVVIDKLQHKERYAVWQYDPYHYCLMVLLERYVLWLRSRNARGDVMAESRGGREDRRLKDSFERVFQKGTEFLPQEELCRHLNSRQLKVKLKSNNITGLQIADLIAHPSFRATLMRRHNQALPENFGGQIARILEASKYYRSSSGTIEGWGRKWLP